MDVLGCQHPTADRFGVCARVSCETFSTQSLNRNACPKSRLDETRTATHSGDSNSRSHSLSDAVFPLLGSSPGETFPFYAIFLLFRGSIFPSFFRSPPLPFRTPWIAHPLSPLVIVYRSCRLRHCCYLHHVSLRLLKAVSAVSPIDWLFGFSRDELFLNDLHEQTGCRACSICFFLFVCLHPGTGDRLGEPRNQQAREREGSRRREPRNRQSQSSLSR